MRKNIKSCMLLLTLAAGFQFQSQAGNVSTGLGTGVPGKSYTMAPTTPQIGERTVLKRYVGYDLVKTLTYHYMDDFWEIQTHNFTLEFSSPLSGGGQVGYTKYEENSDGWSESSSYTDDIPAWSSSYDIGTYDTYMADYAWGSLYYWYSLDISIDWVNE